jgi:putative transposon-encoded protein
MRFKQYLSEEVNMGEVKAFEKKWLAKLKPMGLTAFEFSSHMGKRDFRINRPENIPPITADELDFVMDAFVRKIGSQLKKDIQAVATNTAKKTHPLGMKNKNDVPPNNIEYVIKSKSTKINLAIALHQDKKQGGEMGSVSNRGLKGTAVIVPMTILRKKGFVTNRGVEVLVERRVT